jgi:hypothetical protein
LCTAEYYYCAEDNTVDIVATEDIELDTEIMVFYPQPVIWRLLDSHKKLARSAMTPEQLTIAKAEDVTAKEVAKAAAVVKVALKKESVKAAKAVKAAAKAAMKRALEEA